VSTTDPSPQAPGVGTAADPTSTAHVGLEPIEDVRTRRWLRFLTESTAIIFVVLLVLLGVFTALRPEAFATVSNVRNILIGASVLLVMAVGMTFVIITAGIDLSVGSVLVFSSVVSIKAMAALGNEGWGVVIAGIAVAMAAGLAWGLLNGVLVAKARIPALIVTLGTLGIALGLAQIITGGVNLRGAPGELTDWLGYGRVAGIPWLVIVAAAVTVVGIIVLRFTRFGRYTYAIGSNPEAARRAGINVERHLVKIYAMTGMLSGLAGAMSLARFSSTNIGGHTMDNLAVISAVVIGGTSLFGGIGTVFGSVVGVFIPTVLQNGFVIMRVQPFWQGVAVGVVLIAAVYVDQIKRRSRERL
jgi:ribose transport system permease protein